MNRRSLLTLTGMAACCAAILGPHQARALPIGEYVPNDFVVGAWLVYREKFVEATGRVVDGRAGDISHSEGQGYGMLMAVCADEQRDFKRIWDWTNANLYTREDRLAAWKWDPAQSPHVADPNNATDGDLLIAWALSQAAAKWSIDEYREHARLIVRSLMERVVVDSPYGKILLPGAVGFSAAEKAGGPVVNLSYWVFPALADLEKTFPEFPGQALIRTGLELVRSARFGSTGLSPNWISLTQDGPMAAADYPLVFGYDAIRIPLYVAWLSRDYPDIVEAFDKAWTDVEKPGVFVLDLETATRLSPMQDPGYAAVAALASCSLSRPQSAILITNFEPTDYYPSTLHFLSLMALTERYPECLFNLQ
jgi:endo-1,4-beta-D-glucanase Y